MTQIATKSGDGRSCAALANLRSADKNSFLNDGLYGCLNGEEGGALTCRCGGGLAGSRAGVADARLERNVISGLHSRQPGGSAKNLAGCLAGS